MDREEVGIQVLGPLAVDGSGRLGSRDRAVLLALTVRQGRSVTADELVDAVWGDHPPVSAHKNLQSCVVRLRKALGSVAIETTDTGYRLAVPSDGVDAARFESLVARSRHLLTVGEADRVVFQLEKALALWRGPPFADLPEWAPARREAARLEELRMDAEELLLDAELRRGRGREVLPRAQRMVRAAPLRERRWELLALAQYRTGAQGEALRSIRRLRAVLAGELGIDPSPEVVALEGAILRQDPSLLVPTPRQADSSCPWQGLRMYDVDDAERYFGRDADVAACLAAVSRRRFLAIVGPSGSGKSSLLRAGVLAALRERGHDAVVITPGSRPLDALSALGPDAPDNTVLAVDQAEEIWTMCEELEERQAFLERLTAETEHRPVLLAIRGDRITRATEHPAFGRLVEQGLHLVGTLGDDGLREAVERPAQQAGLVLEPGLVELLVREVRDDPGALPLLSHALLETWRRREGNTLTVDGYHASGGINGAVAQSAEALYAQMDVDQRRRLRGLVLRLVSPGSEGDAVRTRVPRRLVAADADHDRLIDSLVSARLVTSDEDVLEITHEALTHAWPRLRGWLEDDVEGQRIRHHLSGAADAWDGLDRPASELYRGVRLTRALDWASTTETALTDTERDFLEASRVQAEVEEHSAAERARAQARLIKRLRVVLGGAVVLLVLALAAGGVAAVQSDRASRNASSAEQAAVAADAGRVGGRARNVRDFSLPLLLAVAGARLDSSSETRANLVDTLSRRPTLIRSGEPGGGYLNFMSVSADGRWIAASDADNHMHLYDAATNRVVRSYDAGHATEEGPAWVAQAFSVDGSRLAILPLSTRGTDLVRLLDLETMQESATQLAPASRTTVLGMDIRFSGDGSRLAISAVAAPRTGPFDVATARAWAMVWDLRAPSRRPVRLPIGTHAQLVVMSPDGRTLYTNRPLTAWDVATGEVLWQREKLESSALDINPAGTLLAIEDHATLTDVLLLDVADGSTVRTLADHRDWPNETRFSPDGSLLATVARSGEMTVWDPATGERLHRWFTFDAWGVGFSPDSRLVHTGGGADTLLRTWDLSYEDTYVRRTGRVAGPDLFARADVSPDGERIAYSWVDDRDRGWIRFADSTTGDATRRTRLTVLDDQRWFGTWPVGAWNPAGTRYAVRGCRVPCSAIGAVAVMDSSTGSVVRTRKVVEEGDVWSLAYVDDGRRLLVGTSTRTLPDGRLLAVDAASLEPAGGPFDVPAHCCTSAIGSGETALALETSLDGESEHWRVVDAASGEVLHDGVVEDYAYATAASPDGSIAAIAGANGEVVTIDVDAGDVLRRSLRLGAEVLWLRVSDDGERLVTGDTDGGVTLWDTATLERLGTVYPPHRGAPVSDVPPSPCVAGAAPTCDGSGVQFVGDTHDVVIASYDGSVYRWDTDLDRAIDFACQMAGRDLTREEWEQVLPAQPYESVCPQD